MTETGYNHGAAENDDAPPADPHGYNPGAAEDPTTSPEYADREVAEETFYQVEEAVPADSSVPEGE